MENISITHTKDWKTADPGGRIGILELSHVENRYFSPGLEKVKLQTVARLRERYGGFSRADFLALPVMTAYNRYYARFNKTYHVQLQLESIVLHNKELPKVSPLVDVCFAAELETLVLTAGHDTAKLQGDAVFDVSREGDQMVQMNGSVKNIRPGDMVMRDSHGICCSIIYGQDNYSMITPATTDVLYVAYAPAGVPEDAVNDQFDRIESGVRLFSPKAVVGKRFVKWE